jgi:transcriptional regulator with XRE-family HTH domain
MDTDELARRISAVRTSRGLNMTELADKMGVHPSTVSKIEAGTRGVSAYELADLAQALNVDVKELLVPPKTDDVFAVALRSGGGCSVTDNVNWFKEAADDYIAVRKLSR